MADYQGKRFKAADDAPAPAGLHARRPSPDAAPGHERAESARPGTRFRAPAPAADGAPAAPAPAGTRFRPAADGSASQGERPERTAPAGRRFKRPAAEPTPKAPVEGAVGVRPAAPSHQGERDGRKASAGPAAPVSAVAPRYTASSYTASGRAHGPHGDSGSAGSGSVPPGGHGPGRRGGAPACGPRRRRGGVLPKVLIAVGVILLLVAGGLFVRTLLGYRQAEETYSSLAAYAPVSDSADSGVPTVDFDALQAINPDVVGWIYVPGTNINYPVVQGDDNEEYLTHLFDGTANSSGSIFLDADATAPGMVDQQTPLYGHHMNNRSMFYEIDDTVDQAAFDAIESVYYITRDATYRCTPLMTCVVDESFLEARQANFGDAAGLTEYLGRMREHVKAEADDVEERMAAAQQVLTLITCSGELPGADRTVMVLTLDETIPNA